MEVTQPGQPKAVAMETMTDDEWANIDWQKNRDAILKRMADAQALEAAKHEQSTPTKHVLNLNPSWPPSPPASPQKKRLEYGSLPTRPVTPTDKGTSPVNARPHKAKGSPSQGHESPTEQRRTPRGDEFVDRIMDELSYLTIVGETRFSVKKRRALPQNATIVLEAREARDAHIAENLRKGKGRRRNAESSGFYERARPSFSSADRERYHSDPFALTPTESKTFFRGGEASSKRQSKEKEWKNKPLSASPTFEHDEEDIGQPGLKRIDSMSVTAPASVEQVTWHGEVAKINPQALEQSDRGYTDASEVLEATKRQQYEELHRARAKNFLRLDGLENNEQTEHYHT